MSWSIKQFWMEADTGKLARTGQFQRNCHIGCEKTLQWRHDGSNGIKSPASPLFTQPFIQAQIKERMKVVRHWPLCREFTVDRWIPRTNGRWRGKCFNLMTSLCLTNFLLIHLTKPYSVYMVVPQQTRRHLPPGRRKSQDFYLPWAYRCKPYPIEYKNICKELVQCKQNLQEIGDIFIEFQSRPLDTEDFFVWK